MFFGEIINGTKYVYPKFINNLVINNGNISQVIVNSMFASPPIYSTLR